jgi:hypothetical protein
MSGRGETLETNIAKAKHIINILKNGVIPNISLELLCTGREKEIEEFNRCLDDVSEGNGIVKFVSGEYGSGKSFMLRLLGQLAVRRGFLVAKIVINKGFTFNNFENFYYNLMHNLSLHENNSLGTEFEEIFDIWVSKLKNYTNKEMASDEIQNVIRTLNNYNSSFARAFLVYIKAKTSRDSELSNAAASWIKGEKNIPANLKARFDVKGDIDRQNSIDFFKSFISLINLLGYKGTVIVIDELELLMNLRSDLRKNAYENLRYLVDSSGAGEFNKCMFVFAGTDEFFEDSEKGIKTYASLYQRLRNGLTINNSSFLDMRKPILSLKKLGLEDIQALTDKIVMYHREAFNWIPKISNEAIRNWTLLELKKSVNPIMPVNTRIYITKLIDILDIIEQNPNSKLYCSELRLVKKNGVDMFVNSMLNSYQTQIIRDNLQTVHKISDISIY